MLWNRLNRDQRLAFYDLLKVSAYSREEDNLKVKVTDKGEELTFNMRSKDSFYRNKIKNDRLDLHEIKFVKLLPQSRLLRYLLKHPTILMQWINNRVNADKNAVNCELNEVKFTQGKNIPLRGFPFGRGEGTFSYWVEIYEEASKEKVRR